MKDKQVFFNGRAIFWGFGLSNLLKYSQNGFWISIILGTIIGLSILLIVKGTNKNYIYKSISGFVLAFLAAIILVNMGSTLYLRNTPVSVLTILPIIGAFVVSMNKNYAFKKTSQYLFIYSIVILILGFIILTPQVKIDNLLPCSYSTLGIIKGTWIYALTSVVPVICLNDFENKNHIIKNYLLVSLSILLTVFFVVSVLGGKEAILYRYPEYIVLKRIRIYEFFSNVDNLFVGALIADLLFTMSSGFKNIFSNKTIKYVSLIILFFLVSFVTASSSLMTIFYNIFPLILFVLLIMTIFFKK